MLPTNDENNDKEENKQLTEFKSITLQDPHYTLEKYEKQYLDKIADDSPEYSLLKRLCIYFRGKYDIEEIMWRENVDRNELLTVLETYKDILVRCII